MNNNMNDIIRQLKEYEAMEKELKKEVEALKKEAIEYMTEQGIDEYVSDAGKCTYRSVISNRIDTTSLKKKLPELYAAFLRKTENMRFTLS